MRAATAGQPPAWIGLRGDGTLCTACQEQYARIRDAGRRPDGGTRTRLAATLAAIREACTDRHALPGPLGSGPFSSERELHDAARTLGGLPAGEVPAAVSALPGSAAGEVRGVLALCVPRHGAGFGPSASYAHDVCTWHLRACEGDPVPPAGLLSTAAHSAVIWQRTSTGLRTPGPARDRLATVFCEQRSCGELCSHLAAAGVPASAIRLIREQASAGEREELRGLCRNGTVAVLVAAVSAPGRPPGAGVARLADGIAAAGGPGWRTGAVTPAAAAPAAAAAPGHAAPEGPAALAASGFPRDPAPSCPPGDGDPRRPRDADRGPARCRHPGGR